MPPFPRPRFDFDYDAGAEIEALRQYRAAKPGRDIPQRRPDRLLLGSWNIANLGLQQRREPDYRLIAEMISWFDIVAVQECNDNMAGLHAIRAMLPPAWRMLFSDAAGNNERLVFLYDAEKVLQLEKVGEIGVPPKDVPHISLPGVGQTFAGFDRSPYIGSFKAGNFRFMVVNVHLYFGDDSKQHSIDRRCLEAFAVARWADLRRRSKHSYTRDVIAIGDFNLPKVDPADPIYRALTRRGLKLPKHSTEIGSSISSDNHYDQVAFFPGETGEFTGKAGVFDFDGALFGALWEARTPKDFYAYMRYYISDHRLLWAEFATDHED